MEKAPKEEDLRGLEEEIESAIDRLFVEKDQGSPQGRLAEPPSTPSYTAPGREGSAGYRSRSVIAVSLGGQEPGSAS